MTLDSPLVEKIEVEAKQFYFETPTGRGTDQDLTLYYDETNNFGNLKLSAAGLNVTKSDNFVLGGIVLKSNQNAGDVSEFRELLRIQPTADEVKFDMVGHGAFEKVLGSSKLNYVLKWLLERDIGIHYTNLNIVNWFIVDIIDSIIACDEFASYFLMHRELKNELHNIATKDMPGFLALINRYDYPNVERKATFEFLKELYSFLVANWPETVFAPTNALKEIILRARVVPELCFLVGNSPGVLIKGIDSFFLYRLCAFKNSSHIFDEEKSVREAIEKYRITHDGREIPYQFVDSKQHLEIQLSDIVAGFLGRYFSFIEKTPTKSLITFKKDMNQAQKSNVSALRALIEKSDALSNVLLHRVTTIDSDNKGDYFIFDTHLSPHLKATNR